MRARVCMPGPRLTPVKVAVCSVSTAAAIEMFDETRSSTELVPTYTYVVAMTTATPTVGQYERIASPYPWY